MNLSCEVGLKVLYSEWCRSTTPKYPYKLLLISTHSKYKPNHWNVSPRPHLEFGGGMGVHVTMAGVKSVTEVVDFRSSCVWELNINLGV